MFQRIMASLFPQEIIDQILDHNHSDVPTLRSCSLTCHSWERSSRLHLFYTVTLVNLDILLRFSKLIESSPRIASFVRELRIKAYDNWCRRDRVVWVPRVAPKLANHLVRLKTLRFEHIEWDHMRIDRAFLNALARFSRVEHLHFFAANFCDFVEFESVISVFPRLSSLSLDSVQWKDGLSASSKNILPQNQASVMSKQRPSASRRQFELSSIYIGRFCDTSALSWLLPTSSSRSSLRRVEFLQTNRSQAEDVNKFLHSLGSSLEHLKLGCEIPYYNRTEQPLGNYINISHNTGLRSLHIRILDLQDYAMLWIPAFLCQVASTRLTQLVFDIWLYHSNQLQLPVWDIIAWILSHQKYRCLEAVTFVHRGELDLGEARTIIQARLPDIHLNRRILQVRGF
ncbi:hypothetical protein AcV7_004197 [Taiwanofungus camphoratus]|nr:hypothetical protein AcV7_004197 [Antrodia cinnamomea]